MPEHTFATPEPIQLYVENGSGSIDISAADVGQTEVRVEGKNAEQVVVTHDRGTVNVVAPKERGMFGDPKLDIDVVLPTGSSIVVKTGSADITATGRLAAAKVKSGSGDVSLERLSGPASVDTGSGDVAIAETAELRVRSGSGDIRVDHVQGSSSISTGSGDIRLERSAAPVVVKTGSGDLEIGDAEADVAMTTGSGDTMIGTARRGRITSKGASGDVRIGVPPGTPVWTDITTVTGTVRSQLEGVGEPEPGADYVELRANTVSGDVHLRPA